MRLTTLCYMEKDGCWLMMHRVRKQQDENSGKWIGIGGHLEDGESPDECMLREIREETGLAPEGLRLRGILTFILPDWGDELPCHAKGDSLPPLPDCQEGVLQWVPLDRVTDLSLWEGDRIFLPLLLSRTDLFSLKLIYASGGSLVRAVLDGEEVPVLPGTPG